MQTRSQTANKQRAAKVSTQSRPYRRLRRSNTKYRDDDYIVEDDVDSEDTGIFNVNINFAEASTAWKKNKKSIDNGCYTYRTYGIVTRSKSKKN